MKRSNDVISKTDQSSPLSSEEEEIGYLGGEALSQEGLVDQQELLKEQERRRSETKGYSEDEIEDKVKKVKKPRVSLYGHLGRLDKTIKLSDYRSHRSIKAFQKQKDTYDCITLRLDKVPNDPTTLKEIDEVNFYKSIFGQTRNFSRTMAFLTEYRAEPEQKSGKNSKKILYKNQLEEESDKKPKKVDKNQLKAIDYIESEVLEDSDESRFSDKEWIKTLREHEGVHGPQWLHTIADCLGGPIAIWNGAAGGHGANTQMLALEGAIKSKPGIGVEVKAYTRPGTRIAEWYEYKVIAYDNEGNEIKNPKPLTIIIDGQRQWYTFEDWKRDRQEINEFLSNTELKRSNQIALFELPEIVSIDLINGHSDWLYKGHFEIEEGPVFSHKGGHFTNLDYGNPINEDMLGHNRYEGYRKRSLIKFPFHNSDIMTVIKEGDLENLLQILNENFEDEEDILNKVDYKNNTLLHYAAFHGNLDLVIELLEHIKPLSINDMGENFLHCAAKAGHNDILKNFISGEIDEDLITSTDNQGNNLLHLVMLEKNTTALKFLLESKLFNPNDKNILGETPLHLAAKYDFSDAIDILIEYGAKINEKDNDGNTPLHTAAKFNRSMFVYNFRENADFSATNNEGYNVLHIASQYNSTSVIETLFDEIEDAPDINSINPNNGYTALHCAAEIGQADSIHILCQQKNVDINITDNNENTPLHIAALNNNASAILAMYNTKYEVKDNYNADGYTALHLAALENNLDAIQVLVKQVDVGKVTNNSDTQNTAIHLAINTLNDRAVRILIDEDQKWNERVNIDYTEDIKGIMYTPEEWANHNGAEVWFHKITSNLDSEYFIEVKDNEADELDEQKLSFHTDEQEEFEGYGSFMEEKSVSSTKKESSKYSKKAGFFYDCKDMQQLLDFYIGDKDVHFLTDIDLNQHDGETLATNLDDNLNNQILKASETGKMSKFTVCPLNIANRHWAALVIEQNFEDKTSPTIYFVDSLGQSYKNQATLVEAISNSVYKNASIRDLSSRYQNDGFRCGSWAIAHIESLVKNGAPVGSDFDIVKRREIDDSLLGYTPKSLEDKKAFKNETISNSTSNPWKSLKTSPKFNFLKSKHKSDTSKSNNNKFSEESIKEGIANCASLKELLSFFIKLPPDTKIPSKTKLHIPLERVIAGLDGLCNNKVVNDTFFPRAWGIREKVQELKVAEQRKNFKFN
jgi:ankyrin repeat protein